MQGGKFSAKNCNSMICIRNTKVLFYPKRGKMKVNPIISYTPTYYDNLVEKQKKLSSNPIKTKENISNNLYYSPINFEGRKKDRQDYKNLRTVTSSFTPESEDLYELGKTIAKRTGSKELETWHLYLASLYTLHKYAKNLDEGVETYDPAGRKKLPVATEGLIAPNFSIFANEQRRKKAEKVINTHIKSTIATFRQQEGKKPVSSKLIPSLGISPSKDTIDDLISAFDYAASVNNSSSFLDNYFLVASNYTKNLTLSKEAASFRHDLQKTFMIDNSSHKKKYHLRFFDDKADAIWKNLDIGNNAVFLCDANNKDSSNYLVSSFVNLINKPGQTYKNLKPETTDIVVLNEEASFEFVFDYIKEIAKDPKKAGRATVFVGDMISLIKNNPGAQISSSELGSLKNGALKLRNGGNVNFVFLMAPENYYANTANGADFSKVLSEYAIQTIPSLNATDAKKYLTDENGLKFVQNETGSEFSKSTIEKAIELTSLDDGNYPSKALSLLSSATKYYVDKKQLTPSDIERYIEETKALSETSSTGDKSNIIFDTGKTTEDIIGSPMTKKDAKSIVNQILNGTIGTKGFIAQLDNGSSYGGGRRHTAEAIAGEAKIPMIVINAKDFALKDIDALSQNASLSEMKIRKIVSTAKAQAEANENKTAMIFIENFDNFGANPLYGISSIYEQKAFSQLLDEMENARKNDKVNLIIVGSANMPGVIDPNIMKPYKFLNSIIVYPPQDSNERKEVLDYYIKKMNLEIAGETDEEKDKVVKSAAETTYGFTVADLMYLLDVVKSVQLERNKDKIDSSDFTEAYLRATSGRTNEMEISPARKKIVTSHEAGHAIALQVMYEIAEKAQIPWHLPDKVNFITLDPRGNFGGAMYHKNSGNEEYSFEKIMSDLVCSFGGHSSEKIIYNMTGSYGITSDMEHVTGLARAAVLDMGMGPKTGPAHVQRNALGSPDVSEKKLAIIEDDVDSFVNSAGEISDMIIETYKDFILKFTEKYSDKVGSGDCLISSETFIKELNEWRQNQPEEVQEQLKALENKISEIIKTTKTGKKN